MLLGLAGATEKKFEVKSPSGFLILRSILLLARNPPLSNDESEQEGGIAPFLCRKPTSVRLRSIRYRLSADANKQIQEEGTNPHVPSLYYSTVMMLSVCCT